MMTNNKKQSIINPYTGRRMEMNTYSGKELMWRDTSMEESDRALTDDEYYDYWEDDRLYQDPEVNRYE